MGVYSNFLRNKLCKFVLILYNIHKKFQFLNYFIYLLSFSAKSYNSRPTTSSMILQLSNQIKFQINCFKNIRKDQFSRLLLLKGIKKLLRYFIVILDSFLYMVLTDGQRTDRKRVIITPLRI